MYTNIGQKIMALAKVLGYFLLIAGCLVWVITIFNNAAGYYNRYDDAIGWACLLGGLLNIIFTWPLYAFGQIVDDVHSMRQKPVAREYENEELPQL